MPVQADARRPVPAAVGLRRGLPSSLVALVVAAVFAAPAAANATCAERVAELPVGGFLENLLVEPDGSVLFTDYAGRTIHRYRPGKGVERAATLPAHPVSLARRGPDLWVVAHGSSFMDGPGFAQTNRLLRLSPTGTVAATIAAPDARFLNGTANLRGGDLLIADSAAGTIWRFAPDKGTLAVWLRDPLLGPDPKAPPGLPGANGIEIVGKRALVSNSSRGVLLAADLDARGAPGALRTFAKTGPIDDFYVKANGDVIAATHGTSVIRIDAAGTVSTILPQGADGSTAVAPAGADTAYVTTTGAAPGRPPGPAALLRLSLGRCTP